MRAHERLEIIGTDGILLIVDSCSGKENQFSLRALPQVHQPLFSEWCLTCKYKDSTK